MQEQFELARSARRMRIVALTTAIALALATVAGAVLPSSIVSSTGLSRGWGFTVSAISIGLAVGSLVELGAMLREVEEGRVFAPATMRHFRRFSTLFLLCGLANVALPPIVQLVSLISARGHGEVTMSLSDRDLLTLLAGVLMFFIARMFDEAVRLDDDNRAIV